MLPRVSAVHSLVNLSLQKIIECSDEFIVNLPITQRVFLFEKLLEKKEIHKKTLLLLTQGERSELFLPDSKRINFSKQKKLQDEAFHFIRTLFPQNIPIKFDFSSCYSLSFELFENDSISKEDNLLVQAISFRSCKRLSSLRFLLSFCKIATINELDLSFCTSLPSEEIGWLGGYLKKLKILKLYGLTIKDEDFCKIIKCNFELEEIDIRGCPFITGESIHCIIDNQIKLHTLLLGRNKKITEEAILRFLLKCGKGLKKMTFNYQAFSARVLLSLPFLCTSLNTLDLSTASMINDDWLRLLRFPTEECLKATNSTLEYKAEDGEIIREWVDKISGFYKIFADAQINMIGQMFLESLTDINLSHLSVTDQCMAELFSSCKNLLYLNLRGNKGTGLETMNSLKVASNLRSINVNYTTSQCYSPDGLGQLMKSASKVYSFSASAALTNETILEFLSNERAAKSITQLLLWWADSLKDHSIKLLIQRCGPSLRWVNFGLCYLLHKESLLSLAHYCPLLSELVLTSVPNLTDDVVLQICKGCPRLESVNVAHDRNLTDLSLEYFGKYLPRLKELVLINLIEVTDLGLSKLLSFTKGQLEILSIEGLKNVTDASFSILSCFENYNLISLDISSTRFSTEAIIQVIGACNYLESIRLAKQIHVDDSVVEEICKLPFLTELDVTDCTSITNTGLNFISNHCRYLSQLKLGGCTSITSALQPVLENNPYIYLVNQTSHTLHGKLT